MCRFAAQSSSQVYSDHLLFFDLIYTSSHTCSKGQPPATP
jgi:hypothetical protein